MRLERDALDERTLRQLLDRAAEPVEPLADDELSRLARAASAVTDREHVLQLGGRPRGPARRPGRPARWALALAAALVLALLGGIGLGRQLAPAAESAQAPVLPPLAPTFEPADGWTVVDAGIDAPPGTQAVLAANVPIDSGGGPLELTPPTVIAGLPDDGILIAVAGRAAQDVEGRTQHGTVSIPLAGARASTRWEGAAGSERALAEYSLVTQAGGLDLDVRVTFGSAEPSAAQLDAAQRQLDRLAVRTVANQVTISARPTSVRWAEQIAVSGAISAPRAGERVMIEIRECGTSYWRVHDIATTTSGGQWFSETSVGINGVLRARTDDAASAPVRITTRPGLILYNTGGRPSVSVIATRPFWRKPIVIERFDRPRQRWVPHARALVGETFGAGNYIWSHAKFPRTRLGRGTLYRAVMTGAATGPCYLAAYSNMLRP